jgi:Ser/Thr protein kinase RdoA (MazF antagonist)
MTPQDWHELAERFGLGQVLGTGGTGGTGSYVTRGAMGEIWRLATSRGIWAVKWQFGWAPAPPHPADVPVQLAAAAAGIPLPRPVLTPAGEAVAQAGERHARVYEWVDLAPVTGVPAPGPVAAEAGRLLGVLHKLALRASEPDDPWYSRAPSAADWAALAERAGAAGMSWAGGLAAARDLIAGLTTRAAGPQPSGQRITCHRDFNPDNVIPAAAGGRPAGGHLVVLDWEECGPLDPSQELGYALFAWCTGQGQISTSAMTALLGGYTAALGERPRLSPAMFTTAIAVHLNFLHVMAAQAIEDPDHRDFAEQQVTGLLDHDLAGLARFCELAPGVLRASAAPLHQQAGQREHHDRGDLDHQHGVRLAGGERELKAEDADGAHQHEADDRAAHQQRRPHHHQHVPGQQQDDGRQDADGGLHGEQHVQRRDVPVGGVPQVQVEETRRDEQPGIDDVQQP